jgi:outer membrane protein OmpA-like peptidoglycan-associated protein
LNKEYLTATGKDRWSKFAAKGGAGLEIFLNQGASVGVEALYYHIVPSATKADLGIVTVSGMLNVYFGAGAGTLQAREDAQKARQEAEEARKRAEAAQAEAKRQREAAQKMLEEARLAKQEAEAARAEGTDARMKAEMAQKAAEEATQRAEIAKREARQAEAALNKAQAELDRIKEMVAKKDISPINFKPASSDLLIESHRTLDLVAGTAKKYPGFIMRVEGHTDSIGKDAYNLRLSQQRAESVRRYLINQGKLNPNQVVAVGFGESRPIADNKTEQGRALNRRVEFFFILK